MDKLNVKVVAGDKNFDSPSVKLDLVGEVLDEFFSTREFSKKVAEEVVGEWYTEMLDEPETPAVNVLYEQVMHVAVCTACKVANSIADAKLKAVMGDKDEFLATLKEIDGSEGEYLMKKALIEVLPKLLKYQQGGC